MDTYHWHFEEAKEVKKIIEKYGREDVAAKAQKLLEREMMAFIKTWVEKEKVSQLATAGGVFLNVKLNQQVVESHIVDDYYIFPNAGDSGLALGAALFVYYQLNAEENIMKIDDIYWGPDYTNEDIDEILKQRHIYHQRSNDVARECAELIANNKIVGWFQGKMESGPRALGARSILYDARSSENKDIINARVKFREPFRPFCPSMTYECINEYLYEPRDERFMITAYKVKPEMIKKIPAVVHVDGTCRPQFVHKELNPKFWNLINHFGKLTGTPVVMNTSFNIKGEPIVCSPRDAIKCFFDTGIDILAIGDFIIKKRNS
jgi:carbamoyltransferase